ncbi:O-acyltransferase like protein-like [Convolutriloba macropyga]|uniref:O-acyltransferase like protein-like n=1 Tax=Convolutriloba macropyga TaxID=536237 RepID=UPI003F51CAEE
MVHGAPPSTGGVLGVPQSGTSGVANSTINGGSSQGSYGTAEIELLKIQDHVEAPSKSIQLILCFSMVRNLSKAYSYSIPDSSLNSQLKPLYGLKALTIFGLVWTHALKLAELKTKTELTFEEMLRYHSSFILTAILFTLSTTFNTYHNMEVKYESRFNYFLYILKRIFRLFPNYLLAILFVAGLLDDVKQPNMTATTDLIESCRSDIWRNLLFINNFFKDSLSADACLPQMWFVAANLQLWLFTPLVWHSFFKFPKLTLTVLACVGFLQMKGLITVSIAVSDFDIFDYYVYQSYSNMPAWCFALITGFLLCNQKVPGIGKKTQCVLWTIELLFVVVAFLSIFFGAITTEKLIEIIVILCPFFASLLVAYLGSGYGGIVNDFLSHGYWVLISRSAYSALLWHWIFIQWFGAPASALMGTNLCHSFFFSVGCYFWAILLSIWIEMPFREMLSIGKK